MDGLIDKARGPVSPAGDSGAVTAQGVRSKMALPAEMGDAYEAVITTAKKIMYSDQMAPQVKELLRNQDMSMGEKLGMGATAVMAMLYTQTNGTIPPQLIIPAAIELVADAGDFVRKAGAKVSDDDIAEGMASVVEMILDRAGVKPDQIPALLQGQQPQAAAPEMETVESVEEDSEPIEDEEVEEEAPPVTPDGKPTVDTTPKVRRA